MKCADLCCIAMDIALVSINYILMGT